ncbi:D-arabinono-1,4-lactone oxidase [Gordonia rhizosphera]|uniref:Putative L-gulono-1,4-lactone dehydrogenase n=1 Tax=Gordonia rhizosphera NBRC 16068 TaxID=1108045 RepID=K6V084_9ACTN|nr:D-arabinono-1,4-lactone oxidase [Gordonia rhizosphera]GAB89228.1 putative L-gulono-1,4-lactone dehydrogenase [Gordonia rhizosphera NBRC 16068]
MRADGRTWRNWGGTQKATPTRVARPADAAQVADLVADTAARGGVVKPVGAGHSFSAIAVADDVQVDLSAMRGLVRVDGSAVTLRAGTHLYEIPRILAPYGLAMANLGDVDRQTIAGAISTGTHGTGLRFGGISTQVTGVTLVTGTGEIVTVEKGNPDLAAAALGLGALGVLVDITLECVPEFGLRAVEAPAALDDALDGFTDRVADTDHHEFYWFPHTECALTKSNTRIDADTPRSGPGRIRRYVDDELLSNKLFGVLCALGARVPAVVPAIAQLSGRALGARTFTDRSSEVFVSSREVRFREMEYAVALHEVPDVLREVRRMIERRRYRVSFPVEVRAAAADELMLSTATGRTTGYIAVHRYHRDDPADSDAYFAGVETIMNAHGGRPHWGKMHGLDAAALRGRYPRFDEFLEVRNRFDPVRVFANDYLRRVLGD